MFYESIYAEVSFPMDGLGRNTGGQILKRSVVTHLLKNLLKVKANKDIGFFIAITKVHGIDKGKAHIPRQLIMFPVEFTCRAFIPRKGEVMQGIVWKVISNGVFLRCGPMKYVFLSGQKIADYHDVPDENPLFLSDGLSRIEVDVVVQFKVLAVKWIEARDNLRREFLVLASLEGNSLGPVSLAGSDDLGLYC